MNTKRRTAKSALAILMALSMLFTWPVGATPAFASANPEGQAQAAADQLQAAEQTEDGTAAGEQAGAAEETADNTDADESAGDGASDSNKEADGGQAADNDQEADSDRPEGEDQPEAAESDEDAAAPEDEEMLAAAAEEDEELTAAAAGVCRIVRTGTHYNNLIDAMNAAQNNDIIDVWAGHTVNNNGVYYINKNLTIRGTYDD